MGSTSTMHYAPLAPGVRTRYSLAIKPQIWGHVMKRQSRVGTVLLAALAGVAGLAVPAAASSGALTVTTLDRTGHAVPTDVSVLNLRTNANYTLHSGRRRALPPGWYGVVAVIAPTGTSWGSTETLGAQTVSIGSHPVSMRFDARRGRHFSVTPNISGPAYFTSEPNICINGTYVGGLPGFDGVTNDVIPSSNRFLRFSYTAFWAQSASGPFYTVVGKTVTGIPSHLAYSYAGVPLARIAIKILKGKAKHAATTLMTYPGGSPNSCNPFTYGFGSISAPQTVTQYVSTGDWMPQITYDNGFTNAPMAHYVGGRTYHLTLNRS